MKVVYLIGENLEAVEEKTMKEELQHRCYTREIGGVVEVYRAKDIKDQLKPLSPPHAHLLQVVALAHLHHFTGTIAQENMTEEGEEAKAEVVVEVEVKKDHTDQDHERDEDKRDLVIFY